MTKQSLMTMATILAMLGTGLAIRSLIPATSAAPQAAIVPVRPIEMSQPATMKIVPAGAVDPKSEIFIGTGDQSAGSWVRP